MILDNVSRTPPLALRCVPQFQPSFRSSPDLQLSPLAHVYSVHPQYLPGTYILMLDPVVELASVKLRFELFALPLGHWPESGSWVGCVCRRRLHSTRSRRPSRCSLRGRSVGLFGMFLRLVLSIRCMKLFQEASRLMPDVRADSGGGYDGQDYIRQLEHHQRSRSVPSRCSADKPPTSEVSLSIALGKTTDAAKVDQLGLMRCIASSWRTIAHTTLQWYQSLTPMPSW